jgi:3-hydroxyacyl-CoA dehydrogenase/enoyl-CoA hydratase/3-hydroxybutyryl-CoA epimerase
MEATDLFEKMLADGRHGRKSRKGFYLYKRTNKRKKRKVDESVYKALGVKARLPIDEQEIVERCVLAMVNEAARCWEEGVIRSLADGDIGAVLGFGFPPFLGGPFRYADTLGSRVLVRKLTELQERLGERFSPAPSLVRMAKERRRFYAA